MVTLTFEFGLVGLSGDIQAIHLLGQLAGSAAALTGQLVRPIAASLRVALHLLVSLVFRLGLRLLVTLAFEFGLEVGLSGGHANHSFVRPVGRLSYDLISSVCGRRLLGLPLLFAVPYGPRRMGAIFLTLRCPGLFANYCVSHSWHGPSRGFSSPPVSYVIRPPRMEMNGGVGSG